MNAALHLHLVSDRDLFERGTARLREWLDDNRMQLSLWDLGVERRRRQRKP